MRATFAPPAPAALRSGFSPGVVRRRPSSRVVFPRIRCSALEQPDTAPDTAELSPAEGSMGDPTADAMLAAALDRDWHVLESFGGPLATSLSQPEVLEGEQEIIVETADAAAPVESHTEAPTVEEKSEDVEKLDDNLIEKEDAKSETDAAHQPHEGAESGDIVTAISDARGKKRTGKSSKTGKATKGGKKGKATTAKRKTAAQRKAEAQAESDMLAAAALWDRDPKWFFLQTKPGCEQSCAISLRNLGACMPHLQIKEVVVPAMKIMKLTKGGKSVKKEERIYPSYILIHMVMDHGSYSEVQAVPNVQFFMGDPNRDKKKDQPFMPPLPVSESELRNVFHRMRTAEEARPETKTTLRPGDSVRILDGRYDGRYATIIAVKPDLNTVTTRLRAFARNVEIELSIAEVIKEERPADLDDQDDSDESMLRGMNTKSTLEPSKNGALETDSRPKLEQQSPGKGASKVSTVLDAIDEPLSAPVVGEFGEFDDLLGDDLPSFPTTFGTAPAPSGTNRSDRKDPVQDLLDMFGDEPDDALGGMEQNASETDAGFEEAEVVTENQGADVADEWR